MKSHSPANLHDIQQIVSCLTSEMSECSYGVTPVLCGFGKDFVGFLVTCAGPDSNPSNGNFFDSAYCYFWPCKCGKHSGIQKDIVSLTYQLVTAVYINWNRIKIPVWFFLFYFQSTYNNINSMPVQPSCWMVCYVHSRIWVSYVKTEKENSLSSIVVCK